MLRAKYILGIKDLDQIYLALIPEILVPPPNIQRSRVAILKKSGKLIISVEANDISSLRAATNTWLGLVSVASKMENILSKERSYKRNETKIKNRFD